MIKFISFVLFSLLVLQPCLGSADHVTAAMEHANDEMPSPVDHAEEIHISDESAENSSDSNETDIEARAARGEKSIITPVNTMGIVGNGVSLSCRGRSDKVDWMFIPEGSTSPQVIVEKCLADKRYIDSYVVDTTGKSCNLEIESLTLAMAGTYTCTDRSRRSTTASAKLVVLASEPMCSPSFGDQSVLKAGTRVILTCSVHYAGAIPPVMTWTDELDAAMHMTSSKTNATYSESSLVLTAEVPSLRPYNCETTFIQVEPSKIKDIVIKAANNLDYSYKWTSEAVRTTDY